MKPRVADEKAEAEMSTKKASEHRGWYEKSQRVYQSLFKDSLLIESQSVKIESKGKSEGIAISSKMKLLRIKGQFYKVRCKL